MKKLSRLKFSRLRPHKLKLSKLRSMGWSSMGLRLGVGVTTKLYTPLWVVKNSTHRFQKYSEAWQDQAFSIHPAYYILNLGHNRLVDICYFLNSHVFPLDETETRSKKRKYKRSVREKRSDTKVQLLCDIDNPRGQGFARQI